MSGAVSRRLFARLLGGMAVAPAVAEAAVKIEREAAVSLPGAMPLGVSGAESIPSPLSLARQKIVEALEQQAGDAWWKRTGSIAPFRIAGLDPDLASMRLPLGTLARMQMARNRLAREEELSWRGRIRQAWESFR